jgi:hypothetical protein
MDFMFEDEVDEVGSDVEAYCPKCKGDTTHVVISKYEDEIRRVQCNPCGDVHSYRKPRGDVEDDVPEPIAAKKRAMMKKLTWEEFFNKHGEKHAKPYEFREHYTDNVIVTHPKFGKGFVSEVMSDSKVEITFKDSRRVLVHNRKDMPSLPLAAEGDGHPSNTKIEKLEKIAKAEKGDKKGKGGKDVKDGGKDVKDAPAAKDASREAKPGKEAAAVKEAAAKEAAKAAAAATAGKSRPKVPAKTSPAAKAGAVAKRTAKPARAVTDSSPRRAAKTTKPTKAAKTVKKGKK